MAQTPASRGVNTEKLDEILRRLEGAPEQSLHNIEVLTEKILGDVTEIKNKIKKLDEVVITGNGKEPLVQRVHDIEEEITEDGKPKLGLRISALEKDVAGYNKLTWIVIGALVPSIIGIFIYLANTNTLP